MAGKVRYLLNRDGRYFARLVIPKSCAGTWTTRQNYEPRLAPTAALLSGTFPAPSLSCNTKSRGRNVSSRPRSVLTPRPDILCGMRKSLH